ncbi:hypothetical protein K437DRAFT_28882 [Tilletiaria anomala UBC 951]|uniref:Uncharacterized protein n=1 Tax=Tilletiaria anomala (strain ATCC 24038 / CBS 436.72 / UBC 951) TaxID=1037660 RepID=A0A066VHY6_TILAU|nr:uncharacterized protein K437DRAFT_28882 [Tilletiaria anomala UBC 951]KDN38205.1 hypothetical protein K437DRAFT_28882 [Tilletiaria anomala UBC 951]
MLGLEKQEQSLCEQHSCAASFVAVKVAMRWKNGRRGRLAFVVWQHGHPSDEALFFFSSRELGVLKKEVTLFVVTGSGCRRFRSRRRLVCSSLRIHMERSGWVSAATEHSGNPLSAVAHFRPATATLYGGPMPWGTPRRTSQLLWPSMTTVTACKRLPCRPNP